MTLEKAAFFFFFNTICFQWKKKEFFLFWINKWWLEACYVLIFRCQTKEHHACTQQKATLGWGWGGQWGESPPIRELHINSQGGSQLKGASLKENPFVFICILFVVLLPFQQIKVVVPDATRKRILLIYPFFKKHLSSIAKNLCVVISSQFSVETLINCFRPSTSRLPTPHIFNASFFSVT